MEIEELEPFIGIPELFRSLGHTFYHIHSSRHVVSYSVYFCVPFRKVQFLAVAQ